MNEQNQTGLSAGSLIWGFVCGLAAGAAAAMFIVPRSGVETRQHLGETSQQLRDKIEAAVTPVDPVAESLAEGKAAARRRRAELGLDDLN